MSNQEPKYNPHDFGYCLRFAMNETCRGCGDIDNGILIAPYKRSTMSYDVRCKDLAQAFLEDEPSINDERHVEHLAQAIQNYVEAWLEAASAEKQTARSK